MRGNGKKSSICVINELKRYCVRESLVLLRVYEKKTVGRVCVRNSVTPSTWKKKEEESSRVYFLFLLLLLFSVILMRATVSVRGEEGKEAVCKSMPKCHSSCCNLCKSALELSGQSNSKKKTNRKEIIVFNNNNNNSGV